MSVRPVSIVVPVYFEEKVVEECYRRITLIARENNLNYEIIFVNDGSTDKTLDILEYIAGNDLHVKVISLSRNFGHQAAITAGMDKASGDAVIVIDADLQDPPELIPEMIKLWEKGYEVVYAKRKKREGETWFKLLTAKLYYRFLNKMSSVNIPADTGDFRLLDRKVVDALMRMPEHNRFVRGMISWIGFRQIPIEYERKERFAGETKYTLKKMLKLASDGIFSFSSKPVKIIETAGIFITFISFLILVCFAAAKITGFTGVAASGWTLTSALILLIGGVQMISIGAIGEYILRIYDESRDRPVYIIDREINTDKQLLSRVEEEFKKKVG